MLQVVAAAVDGAVLRALTADAVGLAEGRVVQTDHLVLQEGQERVRGQVAAGRGCGGRLESFLEVSDMAEQYATHILSYNSDFEPIRETNACLLSGNCRSKLYEKRNRKNIETSYLVLVTS